MLSVKQTAVSEAGSALESSFDLGLFSQKCQPHTSYIYTSHFVVIFICLLPTNVLPFVKQSHVLNKINILTVASKNFP